MTWYCHISGCFTFEQLQQPCVFIPLWVLVLVVVFFSLHKTWVSKSNRQGKFELLTAKTTDAKFQAPNKPTYKQTCCHHQRGAFWEKQWRLLEKVGSWSLSNALEQLCDMRHVTDHLWACFHRYKMEGTRIVGPRRGLSYCSHLVVFCSHSNLDQSNPVSPIILTGQPHCSSWFKTLLAQILKVLLLRRLSDRTSSVLSCPLAEEIMLTWGL